MQTVDIDEAKTQFSRFVDQAEAGEEIVIARAGKPVARLVALETAARKPRQLGLGKKKLAFPEHFDSVNGSEIESRCSSKASKWPGAFICWTPMSCWRRCSLPNACRPRWSRV